MQQLQVLVQPCSPGTVRAQVDMLSAVCNILAQQELLGLQRGAFIRLALGRFSDFLQLLKDLPAGLFTAPMSLPSKQSKLELPCDCKTLKILPFNPTINPLADAVPEEAAKEKLEKLVDSNLARCLQLLFGVTLPHRNLDWAATAVRPCHPEHPFVEVQGMPAYGPKGLTSLTHLGLPDAFSGPTSPLLARFMSRVLRDDLQRFCPQVRCTMLLPLTSPRLD